MISILRTAAQTFAFSCLSALAVAGVVIRWESGEVGAKSKQKSTIWMEDRRVRVESESAGGGSAITIFDGDKGVLWLIQPREGTFTELTAETMMRFGKQMQETIKGLQEQLASRPQQQRGVLDQDGQTPLGKILNFKPPTITFRPKGESDQVGSLTCMKYDQLADGERTAEICVAPFDELHLTDADLKNFQALSGYSASVGRVLNMNPFGPERLPGFPVHTVTYVGGKPVFESTVLSAEQKTLEPAVFALPAGLKKSEVNFLPKN